MAMMKRLTVIDPKITSIPEFTTVMAIVDDQESLIVWASNILIQLSAKSWIDENIGINFVCGNTNNFLLSCPFIEFYKSSRRNIVNQKTFVNYVKGTINEDMYVYLSIDRYYISGYADYGIKHSNHEVLISGYSKKEFYISDFFINNHYRTIAVKYSSLFDAFNNYDTNKAGGFSEIYLLKKAAHSFQFDEHFAFDLLNEYLKCENSNKHFWPFVSNSYNHGRNGLCYGIDVYNRLVANCNICTQKSIDIRSFHIWKEHKCLVKVLLTELISRHIVVNNSRFCLQWNEVIKCAENIELLAIKYKCSGKPDLKKTIINKLGEIKNLEIGLLEGIIESYSFNTKRRIQNNGELFESSVKLVRNEIASCESSNIVMYGPKAYIPGAVPPKIPGVIIRDEGFWVKDWSFPDEFCNYLLLRKMTGEPFVKAAVFCEKASIYVTTAQDRSIVVGLYSMEYFGFERGFSLRVIDLHSMKVLTVLPVNYVKSGIVIELEVKGNIEIEFTNQADRFGTVNLVWCKDD